MVLYVAVVGLLSAAHLCWVRRPKLDWRALPSHRNLEPENTSRRISENPRIEHGASRAEPHTSCSCRELSARTRTTLQRQTQAVMLLLVVSFNVLRQQHQRTRQRQQMTGFHSSSQLSPELFSYFFPLSLVSGWCVRVSRLPSHPVAHRPPAHPATLSSPPMFIWQPTATPDGAAASAPRGDNR